MKYNPKTADITEDNPNITQTFFITCFKSILYTIYNPITQDLLTYIRRKNTHSHNVHSHICTHSREKVLGYWVIFDTINSVSVTYLFFFGYITVILGYLGLSTVIHLFFP